MESALRTSRVYGLAFHGNLLRDYEAHAFKSAMVFATGSFRGGHDQIHAGYIRSEKISINMIVLFARLSADKSIFRPN